MRGSPRAMLPAAEQEPRLLRRRPARAGPPAGAPWRGDRTAAGPSGRDRMAMSGGARSWMCCAGTVLARRHDTRQAPGPDHEPGCPAETPPDARACAGGRCGPGSRGSVIASLMAVSRRARTLRRAVPRARHPRRTPRTRAASAEPGREGGRPHRNGDTARTCASEYTTRGRAIEARSRRLPTGRPTRQRIQERVQVGGPSVGTRLAWPSSVRRPRHRHPREHPPQGEPPTPGDRARRRPAADRGLAVRRRPATRPPRGPAA